MEWSVVRKDGKIIHIYASAGILDNIVGGPYKITTISDISETIEARQIQKEQEALLIQQSKLAAMGEMLGHIAHQWRQPLNVINCTTLDIKLKKEMQALCDTTLENSLNSIESLTDQMSETINDFMDFYKPDKQKKLFSLFQSIRNTHHIIAPQLKAYKINFTLNVDESLSLYGPPGEFQQVILNLLTNAKDAFASKESNEKNLSVHAHKSKDAIVLSIEDNAGGIAESIIEKIFEPYFTTKNHLGGTGIGLYISSMIIRQSFDGTMVVQNIMLNQDQVGARFVLSFPIKENY